MKKSTINLFSMLFLLVATTMFSQGKIKGTVTDSELNGALPGVNVIVKGSTTGASTDMDGKFLLNTTATSGQVVISYVGFKSQTVSFTVKKGETVDLGTIKLASNSNQLEDVVVKSNLIDVAKDRKTPVAVSTIRASEIQQKLGNQEFPEILKNTPSVYASKSGGGFGDSRVVIRGFDQKNIAVMINGVPVNDMENSSVYWSNWAGLSDVTSAMQVQRGLGASKLAISSVGGTINVITKTSDMKEGGAVATSVANNNYLKTQASYNTGLMKNGLSASVLISNTSGNEYADGTRFQGGNYFFALGYKLNKKNNFQVTFTGAPQWHNQRSTSTTIADYIKYGNGIDVPNIRYNADWGYLNGKQSSLKTNYYHKPVASFNWDYKINEKTALSAVVYGSWGRGGGTTSTGGIMGKNPYSTGVNPLRDANGLINFDLINSWNSGQTTSMGTRTASSGGFNNSSASGSATDLSTGITEIASVNSHNWYGGVVNLNKKLTDNLTLDFGVEGRLYKGIHYQNLVNLYGADTYKDKSDANQLGFYNYYSTVYSPKPSGNPFVSTDYQQKINYYNINSVNWYGAFSQLEYSKNNLTAFVQGAVSQQGFKRDDYFKYLASDPLAKTGYKNLIGGDVKAGVNYNLNSKMNVFVNAGMYSKQPFFNAVYPNNASIVNDNLVNEKIQSAEAGYGYHSSVFNANLNVYYTTWKNRFTTGTESDQATNPGGYYTFSGVNETHTGVELDMNAKLLTKLRLNGMVSVGNWYYNGNATSNRFDVSNNPIAGGTAQTLYLDKVKVGNAAQVTAAVGASYEVVKRVSVDANYNYYDKLFANISPNSFGTEVNKGALQLPNFGVADAGFSYKMLVGKNKAESVNFRVNVNNVFDKVYIAESSTNVFASDIKSGTQTYEQAGATYNGVATANKVFFGFGRTWNFGISYNF